PRGPTPSAPTPGNNRQSPAAPLELRDQPGVAAVDAGREPDLRDPPREQPFAGKHQPGVTAAARSRRQRRYTRRSTSPPEAQAGDAGGHAFARRKNSTHTRTRPAAVSTSAVMIVLLIEPNALGRVPSPMSRLLNWS